MAFNKLSIIICNISISSVTQQMVKPPIQLFGLEGRYATALYSAASKEKKLEDVEKELIKFQETLKTDVPLREFIADPSIKRSFKAEALKSVTEKLSLTPLSSNLLVLMAENGRLRKINQIINAFKTIMSAHRGEVSCEVTTAKELSSSQREKLEAILKMFVKSNESILLTSHVDSTILGGMIVIIGDRYVDMSVSSKINKYTEVISLVV